MFRKLCKPDLLPVKFCSAKDGMSFLVFVMSMDKNDVVELFLSEGVDITMKDVTGLTALHYAAINRHQDVVKQLLVSSKLFAFDKSLFLGSTSQKK